MFSFSMDQLARSVVFSGLVLACLSLLLAAANASEPLFY